MTLNFPSNPADGQKYSYTDPITNTTTTYVWRKEAKIWTAQLEDANLETKFVEVAGDNMTGNLTLGTDKITLDAINGDITAKGTSGNVRATLIGKGLNVGAQINAYNDYGSFYHGLAGDDTGEYIY